MSVEAVSQTTVGSLRGSSAATQLADDYQSFLTLLVAQVQNQDPMAPMESTEFVSQLAQLTQVEQSVQVNSQMESLRTQLALNAALSETSLIGRDVTAPSETFAFDGESGQFWYKLESEASTVQAQIRDSEGNLVAVLDNLSGQPGEMIAVSWDGTQASGLPAFAGNYRLSIAAVDASGAAGSYNSYAMGRVTSIDYTGGTTYLQLADGTRVQSGAIVRAQ